MTNYAINWEAENAKKADEIRFLRAELKATKSAIVRTIGGEVEGQPTSSINYLQRLRAMLAEIERLQSALREANTIILAARLYIPRSKDDDNGHGWARDADKWLGRAVLEEKP